MWREYESDVAARRVALLRKRNGIGSTYPIACEWGKEKARCTYAVL